MAQQQSLAIEKVKKSNHLEEQRLRIRLKEISKRRQEWWDDMQKQRHHMMHELRANKVRELRNSLRGALTMEDQVNIMRGASMPTQSRRIMPEVKGFSKVEVEDDDDTETYLQYRRNRTIISADELALMRAQREAQMDETEEQKRKREMEHDRIYNIPDDEVYVRYPVNDLSKPGIITLSDLNFSRSPARVETAPASRASKKRLDTAPSRASTRRPQTEPGPRSRLPHHTKLPKYVQMLQRLGNVTFDQYTDGGMLLALRQFTQKRKERMPAQVGHLPVRKRYWTEEEVLEELIRQYQRQAKISHSDVDRELLSRLPDATQKAAENKPVGNIKFVFPKRLRKDESEELREEQNRLMRLRRAEQEHCYRDAISKTKRFLGHNSFVAPLVPEIKLSREESVMLETLKKSPNYKTAEQIAQEVKEVAKQKEEAKLKQRQNRENVVQGMVRRATARRRKQSFTFEN